MASTPPDNDDLMLKKARDALDKLRSAYFDARDDTKSDFDQVYDLRRKYENAVVEYASLDARLLKQSIISNQAQLTEIDRINDAMDKAKTTKQYLAVATSLMSLLISVA